MADNTTPTKPKTKSKLKPEFIARFSEVTVRVEREGDAAVNKASESLFTIKSELSGKPIELLCTPECHIKSLVDESTIKCEVEVIEDCKLHVKYTPTIRGRHELIVTAHGKTVIGSPFPVFVSINPAELGKPVKIINGLESPMGIAVNSLGQVVVGELDGVVLFDKNGEKLKSVRAQSIQLRLQSILGLCVDPTNDSIYVAGARIVKLDGDLDVVKYSASNMYRDVTVVGDKVVACREENNNLEVFTKDLERGGPEIRKDVILRQFGTICGVCSSKEGKLFISDFQKGCIHMVSSEGKFLFSISTLTNMYDTLSGPLGVSIFGQYLYVVEHRDNCVVVFTTSGRYVTKFCKRGAGEGNIFDGRGVCIDEDGFVYVCDSRNNRVQIF
jgi:tripartite motif-containing protein 2/3/tripartite motif-containing protein 71